jgi:hypothetical protein
MQYCSAGFFLAFAWKSDSEITVGTHEFPFNFYDVYVWLYGVFSGNGELKHSIKGNMNQNELGGKCCWRFDLNLTH